nr:cleavage stimulation factor subunit 77 [Ipomoea batatas]
MGRFVVEARGSDCSQAEAKVADGRRGCCCVAGGGDEASCLQLWSSGRSLCLFLVQADIEGREGDYVLEVGRCRSRRRRGGVRRRCIVLADRRRGVRAADVAGQIERRQSQAVAQLAAAAGLAGIALFTGCFLFRLMVVCCCLFGTDAKRLVLLDFANHALFNTSAGEMQWMAWKRFLAFEKGNPQRIDTASSN